MDASITIVIPTFNSSTTLAPCITACLNQDYQGPIQVIVVDDGSTDPTARLVGNFPEVRYIQQENGGPAKARNTGWQEAASQIVCFTDSDCVPNPQWVSRLVHRYDSDRIGGVGGSYSLLNGKNLLARCIHQEIVYRHARMPTQAVFLGSYNASFRKDVLERAGGFDETYAMASGEDNDLSYRVIQLGYQLIFDPTNTVGHHHPTGLLRYWKRQFWHGYWRMKLYGHHPKMAHGDGYSSPLDFIQPPLLLAIFFLIPFWWIPGVAWLWAGLAIAALGLQVPFIFRVVLETKDLRYLVLFPILIGRAWTRGMGMLYGVLKFFILKKSPSQAGS